MILLYRDEDHEKNAKLLQKVADAFAADAVPLSKGFLTIIKYHNTLKFSTMISSENKNCSRPVVTALL